MIRRFSDDPMGRWLENEHTKGRPVNLPAPPPPLTQTWRAHSFWTTLALGLVALAVVYALLVLGLGWSA